MRLTRCLLLAPIGLLIAISTQAQKREPGLKTGTPVFTTQARDVIVDVVVTGDNGQPVTGLRKQSFQVFEDSKPQAIDFFEEHSANTLPSGSSAPCPKCRPACLLTFRPRRLTTRSTCFCSTRSTPTGRIRLTSTARYIAFLKRMDPETRTAVFTLGSRLRMIQGFTSDSIALVAAVNDPRFGDMRHEARGIAIRRG